MTRDTSTSFLGIDEYNPQQDRLVKRRSGSSIGTISNIQQQFVSETPTRAYDNKQQGSQSQDKDQRSKKSPLHYFIKFMLRPVRIMVYLLNLFNPTKKNCLPPIDNEILLTPAHKLSARIKEGQLTSQQVVEAYIERIQAVQPLIKALAEDRFEEARKEAKQLDERLRLIRDRQQGNSNHFDNDDDRLLWQSPLAGVPISVKESIGIKGMRQTCGLWFRRDQRAQEDSVAVGNARKMGVIPVVTTNVPELTLYWADCVNKIYGRTYNPYDLSRVPGASSGGEGSLLGSGGSLIGMGSDIGGSLRIPAHFCGIFSHKPSPFAVNCKGNFPEMKPRRLKMFSLGPMARYASDLKPLLKCMLLDHQPLEHSPGQLDSQLQHQRWEENEAVLKHDENMELSNETLQAKLKLVEIDLDTPVNYSDLTIYYCDFSDSTIKPSLVPQKDMTDGIHEIVEHFATRHRCRTKAVNLDKYMRYAMVQWQVLMKSSFKGDAMEEIKSEFGMGNLSLEWLKLIFGSSKHTKESMLAILITMRGPSDATQLCQRFIKMNAELRKEFNDLVGENSVLIMPTLPASAYKHNEALMRTQAIRYTILFNILQCPATQAMYGFEKQNSMPFGYSIAAKQGMDRVTLAVAEEIELRFGGWRPRAPQKNDQQLDNSIKSSGEAHHSVASKPEPMRAH